MFGHFTTLCMKGLSASLLGNMLAGKGVITAGKGTIGGGQDFQFHLNL